MHTKTIFWHTILSREGIMSCSLNNLDTVTSADSFCYIFCYLLYNVIFKMKKCFTKRIVLIWGESSGCQSCWFWSCKSESSIWSYDCWNRNIPLDGSWGTWKIPVSQLWTMDSWFYFLVENYIPSILIFYRIAIENFSLMFVYNHSSSDIWNSYRNMM